MSKQACCMHGTLGKAGERRVCGDPACNGGRSLKTLLGVGRMWPQRTWLGLPPRVSAQTPALILSAGKSLTLSVVDSRHWSQQKEASFLSLILQLSPVLCSVFRGSLTIDQQLTACQLFQKRLPHFLVSSKISGQIEDLAISSRWQESFNLWASLSQDDPE